MEPTTFFSELVAIATVLFFMWQMFRSFSNKIDQRFEKIDQRFEKIDQRFEKIDQRFIEVLKEIKEIKEDVLWLKFRQGFVPKGYNSQEEEKKEKPQGK